MATRATLRRLIGERTSQIFFRDFGGTVGDATGGTTTTLIDTVRLLESDSLYWKGSYLYLPASDEVRRVTTYTPASKQLTWLAAVANAPVSGTDYELWGDFTPREVHAALDYGLSVAWPHFFLTGNEEMVIQKEKEGALVYTLPTTNIIHRLCRAYIKAYNSTVTGTVTTQGTTTQVIDSKAPFKASDVNKWITVYGEGGAANGNRRQILTFTSSTTVVVSSAFSVALPVGAEYRMIDRSYHYPIQVLLQNWQVDQISYPTTFWLSGNPAGYEGHVIHLEYEYDYPLLTAETTNTTAPQEFVLNMALAYLYYLKIANADATQVEKWRALYQGALNSAQLYAKSNHFQHLPGTHQKFELNTTMTPSGYPF